MENYRDLEIPVRDQSRSFKVIPVFEIFDFKCAVILKTGIGVRQVIENVTIR